MKILLVAPVYLNLYKIIKDELVAEGHSVVYFPEGMLPWNPYYRYPNPIKLSLIHISEPTRPY